MHKMLLLSYYNGGRPSVGASPENRGLVDDLHPFTVNGDTVTIAYEKHSLKGQMVKAKKTGERMIAFENGVVWCFSSEVPPPPPPRATLK